MIDRLFTVLISAAALSFASCGTGDKTPRDGSDAADAPGEETVLLPCSNAGDTLCSGQVFKKCTGGVWRVQEDCGAAGKICDDAIGCAACHPGRTFCEGSLLKQCDGDGQGATLISDCGALTGMICDIGAGACISLCEDAANNRSNIGCVYWAVDLDNAVNSVDNAAGAQFAVVIANVNGTYDATVTITIDESDYTAPPDIREVETADIPPGSLYVFALPRRDIDGYDKPEHDDTGPQTALSNLAFRIESTIPVVAYQFNPIDQAFSNAASLLIPESGIDTLYYVIDYPPANPINVPGLTRPNRDYVTVVGTQADTLVRVTPSYGIDASIPPFRDGFQAVETIRAGAV